jgi:hypothetical protein
MATAKTKKLKVQDVVGNEVRLHSQLWIQGYCDGICTGYDSKRGVLFFRRHGQQLDEGTYEVRNISQFELL